MRMREKDRITDERILKHLNKDGIYDDGKRE